MCTNFQTKRTTLIFWAQICPKVDFGVKILKSLSLDSESPSLRYYVYQFSFKTDNFELLGPSLPKNGSWGQNFKSLSLDLESATLRYYVHQFSDKKENFEFLGPNLPKNKFWGQNFKSLSLDSESAPPI